MHSVVVYCLILLQAIAQNEELRAWYAKDYAAQMGAPLLMSLTEMVLNVPSRSTSPIENGIDFFGMICLILITYIIINSIE